MTDDTVVLLDLDEHPAEARAQRRIIDILHTRTGGEELVSIRNVEPEHCNRCLHLSRQLMQITGVWPHGRTTQ